MRALSTIVIHKGLTDKQGELDILATIRQVFKDYLAAIENLLVGHAKLAN
jgi:hypothetical protein